MESAAKVSRFQLTYAKDELVETFVDFNDPRFHLHLVQKAHYTSERPKIDASKAQRLAYYRTSTSTTSKMDIIPTQVVDTNSFLWFYTLNVFFKTLPHSFVHFFIAAYAPEEHMFVTKMVPISHGLKYLFVLTGVLEILCAVDVLLLIFTYCITGLLFKSPWNRCPKPNVYFDEALNTTVTCYLVQEFRELFINKSYDYHEFTYIRHEGHFQVSQIDYYRNSITSLEALHGFPIFLFILGSVSYLHMHVVNKIFWKIFTLVQWVIITVDIITFVYIVLQFYQRDETIPIAQIPVKIDMLSRSQLWSTDADVLAESITAPSVVHVLTARSDQDIDPGQDSSAMVASNAVLYIFRGLLTGKFRDHCEAMVRTQIPITQFNHHAWLFLWPMFWSEFSLGDIAITLYLILNMILESGIAVVNYECLMESIIYEWPKIRRFMMMAVIYLTGIVLYFTSSVDQRLVLWIYAKTFSTFLETVFIYIFYPVGRLVDDFTFHYGVPPTQLRILSMRLVPIYYFCKSYIMVNSLWSVLVNTHVGALVVHYTWSWAAVLMPVVLGFAYIAYKYLVRYRMTWPYLFRPKPKWGPQDFSERQLRKQYDSRNFIGSEAPKLLTRYLTAKRDSKVYKIDVRYDFYRRSTVSPMAVRFGEKKEKTV